MRKTLLVLVVAAGCELEGGLLGRIEPRPRSSPDKIEFVALEGIGALDAKQLVLGNDGDKPAQFTLEEDASWLKLSAYDAASTGPDDDVTVDVTATITGLAPGGYSTIVWVRSDEWEKAVRVELAVAPAGTNVIYVSVDGDDGSGDGTFQNPYRTVTRGVSELSPPSLNTVYVLPSDQAYTEGETFPIALVDETAVTAAGPEYVEIQGAGSSGVFDASATPNGCVLWGLTVSNGSGSNGGGLAVTNSSSVGVTDCVFEDCSATNNGGAIYVEAASAVSLADCAFKNCSATNNGGAIYVAAGCSASFSDCVFRSNSAQGDGGAVFDASGAVIDRCVFEENDAGDEGGGIYLSGGGVLGNSVFDSNSANKGGGIYATSTIVILMGGCSISGNHASTSGGGVVFDSAVGIVPTFFANCVIDNNTADVTGGGVYVAGGSTVAMWLHYIVANSAPSGGGVFIEDGLLAGGAGTRYFRNSLIALNQGGGIGFKDGSLDLQGCTVVDNTGYGLAKPASATGSLSVVNGIFWGNDDDLDNVDSADVSYTDIETPDWPLALNNISDDPSFVDPSSEDYHLKAGSPCMDVGLNGAWTGANDLDGNDRVVDGDGLGGDVVDMGCYECQPPP